MSCLGNFVKWLEGGFSIKAFNVDTARSFTITFDEKVVHNISNLLIIVDQSVKQIIGPATVTYLEGRTNG